MNPRNSGFGLKRLGFAAGCALLVVMLSLMATAMFVEGDGKMTAKAAESSDERTINVNGDGLVKVKPDVAYVSLEVVTQSQTAQGAQSKNADIMSNVLSALKALGLEDKDLSTSGFSLMPVYDQGKGMSQIVGYTAQNQITATVSPEMAGKVIDTGISAGANRVSGLEFSLRDPREAQLKALKMAVEDGKVKAQAMAEAAGYSIKDIKSINAAGYSVIPLRAPVAKLAAFDSAGAPSYETPIVSGDVSVRASVQMVFTF